MRIIRRSTLTGLACAFGLLALSATPALAAETPEAPTLTVEDHVPSPPSPATEATFHTVINPNVAVFPVEEGKYHFVYKPGAGPSCAGGTATTSVPYAGLAPEEFSETVASLTADTEYALCEVVETTGGGKSEAATTFKTALPPEKPETKSATANTTGTTATFNGELNPNATVAAKNGYYFAYGSGGTCEGFTTTPGTEATGAKMKVSTPVTGLEGSTEYTFCVVETNADGESVTGGPLKFKTPASKPVIPLGGGSTPTLTPINASLQALVNPETRVTSYHFEYAGSEAELLADEGLSIGESSIPAASETETAGPAETGDVLTPSTTYYYRVIATNLTGTAVGPVEHFTTSAFVKPAVEGQSVSAVGQTTATLSGVVNPEFQPVLTCEFSYVGTAPLSTSCVPGAAELGEGSGGVGTGANLTDLTPNTEYHYKVLTENKIGLEEGHEETFLTLPNPPTVTTRGFSAVTPTSATVSGEVNPGASGHLAQDDTTYYIEYGGTTAYGRQTPFPSGEAVEACRLLEVEGKECPQGVAIVGEGTSAKGEEATLGGLEPGTTYHYRVVATNLNDAEVLNTNNGAEYGGQLKPQATYGQDATFTTTATPPTLTGVSVQGVTQSTATIVATLEAQGLPTHYELQVGSTPGLLQPAGSGDAFTTTPLSLSVGSLSPGTTYYYKLIAINQNDTEDPVSEGGSFTTAAVPAGAAPAGLPATIPYQSIAELNAKEAKEDKKLPNPTTPLTNAQKLKKALKACHTKKGKKRASCEATAHRKFGAVKKAKKK